MRKVFLFLAGIFLSLGLARAQSVEIDGLYYEVITPSGESGSEPAVSVRANEHLGFVVVIPSEVTIDGNSYVVREIPENAFNRRRYGAEIKTVTLPESITRIGKNAFYGCSELTSINLPESLTSIGDEAFYSCAKLTSINLPESLTSIGDGAFYGCWSLTLSTSHLPEGITSIGKKTFYCCSKLTSISLPESVTSISDSAFMHSGLTSITLPKHISYLGNYCFRGCSSLETVRIENPEAFVRDRNTHTLMGNYVFAGCGNISEVYVADAANTFIENGFNFRSSSSYRLYTLEGKEINEMVIPDGATAFRESFGNDDRIVLWLNLGSCLSVESLTLPAYVTTKFDGNIQTNKYEMISTRDNLENLRTVYCRSTAKIGNIPSRSGVLYVPDLTVYGDIATLQNVEEFPSTKGNDGIVYQTLDGLVAEARAESKDLTSASIQGEVEIGGQTFQTRRIQSGGFSGCTALSEVALPSSVQEIGAAAFDGCSSLAGITIPASVTSISGQAFAGCRSLQAFSVDEASRSFATLDGVLYDKELTRLVSWPGGRGGSYALPASIATIGTEAFSGAAPLEELSIGHSVDIEGWAFLNTQVGTLRLGGSAQGTWTSTPVGCATKAYDISADHPYYASFNGAAFNKEMTTLIHFPKEKSAEGFEIPATTETIGKGAFKDGQLTELAIPENIKEIGAGAFEGCENLKTVRVESFEAWNSVKREDLSSSPFCNGAALVIGGSTVQSLSIPVGTEQVNTYAFAGCTSLKQVKFPYGLTTIGSEAFYNCSHLGTLSFPSTIETLADSAFAQCYQISSLTTYNDNGLDISGAFSNDFNYGSCTACVPQKSLEEYQTDWGWYGFADIQGFATEMEKTVDGVVYSVPTEYGRPQEVSVRAENYDITAAHIQASIEIDGQTYPVYEIGESAFRRCSQLAELTIPDGVVSIGDYAFQTSKLATLVLPASIRSIGTSAFNYRGSTTLEAVYCYAQEPPQITYNTFYGKASTLYVPFGCSEAYKADTDWKRFSNIIEMDDVTSIDAPALSEGGNATGPVSVYDMSGRCVFQGRNLREWPAEKGIYLIRQGKKSQKVLVR